ncbi:MAG: type II-A CRISPR-associated protein Csn2, partial [Lachnospiraceae bacterium]|nr:type II-A CRISPR-associated protein Csn2 [Lachnospiraceae bacterium]
KSILYVIAEYCSCNNILSINSTLLTFISFFSTTYSIDFEWQDWFKMYSIKIDTNYHTLLERLVEYVKIVSTLCGISTICFVGIKQYLSIEEIQQLYKNAYYNKIYLLLIESCESKRQIDENEYIVDKDSCLIIK